MRIVLGVLAPTGRGALGRTAARPSRPADGSATCPKSVASIRRCASRSSSRTSANSTAWPARRPGRGRALAGTLRPAERRNAELQTLSLGNQQRSSSLRHWSSVPEVLVLDEPFAGLDPVAVDVLSAVLREQADAGLAVVFSSHELELVERICDRVGIIDRGHMVASGTVEDLRAAGRERLWIDAPGRRRHGCRSAGRDSCAGRRLPPARRARPGRRRPSSAPGRPPHRPGPRVPARRAQPRRTLPQLIEETAA